MDLDRGPDLRGPIPGGEQVVPGAVRGGVRVGVPHQADHRGRAGADGHVPTLRPEGPLEVEETEPKLALRRQERGEEGPSEAVFASRVAP